jgi:spermidine/putrescine transport system substrate-binding protein
MKRLVTWFLLFLLSAIVPLGCSGSRTNTPQASPNNPTNVNQEKVLNVYNYATYIAPEALQQFEKENGVKVKYDTYEDSEAMYSKLKAGNPGYDLVFPADYLVKTMITEKMLEPLTLKNIPNSKNLDTKFLNQSFDPGNKYSFPYQWGTMGIGYNLKKTGKEIKSWDTMFDPKYKGQIAWQDNMRYTLGAALIYLGYDVNTKNPDEIKKARDLIIKNKALIKAFAPDTGQTMVAQGEVTLTLEWSGDMFQVMKENPDIRYGIPQEGTIVFTDNMVIPKGAPHKELAEKFINFILRPEIGAEISNFIHYGSPNKAAIAQGLIDKKDLQNPQIYPPPELFNKLKFLEDVGAATKLYDRAWTEVKASIGQ